MTTLVSPALRDAFRAGCAPALLVEVDHPAGIARTWSGSGKAKWNGETWEGMNSLVRITGIQESRDLTVRQNVIELRGIPPDAAHYLNANVRNRPATAWLGAWNGKIVDPYLILKGRIDFQELPTGADGRVVLRLNIRVGFIAIERAQDIAWTHEEQQKRFPGDTGFSLIPELVSKDVKWRPS